MSQPKPINSNFNHGRVTTMPTGIEGYISIMVFILGQGNSLMYPLFLSNHIDELKTSGL